MPAPKITPRAAELVRGIKPMLRDGEFVLILTEDFNGVITVPDEVSLRARIGKMTPRDSLGPTVMAYQLLASTLSGHIAVLDSKIIKPGN